MKIRKNLSNKITADQSRERPLPAEIGRDVLL